MLSIKKVGDREYIASATSPHVTTAWATDRPMPARELVKELQARGCHQKDVGDALYEQDPLWLEKL